MANRLPCGLAKPGRQHSVCVICEGAEEACLRNLIGLGVWDSRYKFTIVNAKTASRIPSAYQYHYSSGRYEVVLVFCDTDKYPYREYALVKEKISGNHGNRPEASQSVIIYANPCAMQIVLLHFADDVVLRSQAKRTNAPIIDSLCGVSNYQAHQEQIDAICRQVTRTSYYEMLERLNRINGKTRTHLPRISVFFFLVSPVPAPTGSGKSIAFWKMTKVIFGTHSCSPLRKALGRNTPSNLDWAVDRAPAWRAA